MTNLGHWNVSPDPQRCSDDVSDLLQQRRLQLLGLIRDPVEYQIVPLVGLEVVHLLVDLLDPLHDALQLVLEALHVVILLALAFIHIADCCLELKQVSLKFLKIF